MHSPGSLQEEGHQGNTVSNDQEPRGWGLRLQEPQAWGCPQCLSPAQLVDS